MGAFKKQQYDNAVRGYTVKYLRGTKIREEAYKQPIKEDRPEQICLKFSVFSAS